MPETAQKKFEEARNKLAAAIKNLEEVVAAKINESSIGAKMFSDVDADKSTLQTKIFEQNIIIQNLNDELNKLQKSTNETDKENDFLKDKNRFFADKVFKFKTQGSSLVQAIENDLSRIKEIIKNYS